MPERAWGWTRRIHWGEGRTVGLDWGIELWKWDVSLYECANGIRLALTGAGRSADDDSVVFEATHWLMTDVVDAAGGVEQAHLRLHAAMAAVQQVQAQYAANSDKLLPESTYLSDPTTEAAWYALEEMLLWARVIDDRLRRPALDRKRYSDQGLIPALADGPRRDAVIVARSRLLNDGLREARYLTDLSVHMQSSQAGSKLGRIKGGNVVLRFPDRVTSPIGHRWQLTYNDGRDAISFADGLMAAVTRFMDDMLQAFEDHVPERFRAP